MELFFVPEILWTLYCMMFTFSHFLRFIRLLLLFIVTFFLAWDSLKEFFKKTWFYLNFLIYYLMSKLNLVLGQSFASAFFIGFSVWILLIFVVKILQLNIHGACIIYTSFQWIRLTVLNWVAPSSANIFYLRSLSAG